MKQTNALSVCPSFWSNLVEAVIANNNPDKHFKMSVYLCTIIIIDICSMCSAYNAQFQGHVFLLKPSINKSGNGYLNSSRCIFKDHF